MKPVIMIIVDALTSRVVVPALRRGELPTLAAFAEAVTRIATASPGPPGTTTSRIA